MPGKEIAKKVARLAVTPLVDVPTLPGGRFGRAVEHAIEGSTSPVGILSTALLPVTGGTSLGLRGAAGVGTRLATIGLAEVGTSAAGGLAAEEVANRVQNTPGIIKYGAPVLAGIAGSAGAASGLNRAALKLEPGQEFGFSIGSPRSLYRQGGVTGTPASSYETLLPLSQSKSLLDPSLPRSSVKTKVAATPAREPIGTVNEFRRDFSKIKRGQDSLVSRIQMEARLGRLTPDAVDPAVEFAKSLPKPYLDRLGSTFTKEKSLRVNGRYRPDTSIMTVFTSAINGDHAAAEGTIIHEVAHHLEQFVTDGEYRRIQNTWKATTKPKYDKYMDGLRNIATEYGVKTARTDGPKEIKNRLANIKGYPPREAVDTSWTTIGTGTDSLSNEAMKKVGALEKRFTYAESGGINEWFAEMVKNAELDRQAGRVVPAGIKKFINSTRDIIRGYNEEAAQNVVRRMQAGG